LTTKKVLCIFFAYVVFNASLFAQDTPKFDPYQSIFHQSIFQRISRFLKLSKTQEPDPNECWYQRIDELPMSAETKKQFKNELDRCAISGDMHLKNRIDYIFSLPWGKITLDNLSIAHAKCILDENHYGLEKIKEQILDFISIKNLNKDSNTPAPILCFVGPPGTGKTSIGKSIAKSLGKKYGSIALGGMRDEMEIRGSRPTFQAAMPGCIIQTIKNLDSCNPVIILDEIDKVLFNAGDPAIANPAAAMLEVLDPEQNKIFRDNYLNIPFDLSNVMFIATANDVSTIPEPLRDRMEIIEVGGYTNEEKIKIAQQHLIKKIIEKSGLKGKNIRIPDDVLQKLITDYTQESGVRQLERTIKTLCSKIARGLVEKKELISITTQNLEKHLGPQRYVEEETIDTLPVSAEIKKQIKNEMDDCSKRRDKIQKSRLDYIFSLPWRKTTQDNLSISHAKRTLDEDHSGLEKIKEQILDFISIKNLKKDGPSPILCFVGPPGTGKTSIGKSIARSLGRKYGSIALGGLRDEIEIRGSRLTFEAAMPGRIIQTIKRLGSCNPVIVLDEIDKIPSHFSHSGNPSAAILEVLDPEQNKVFHDNYLNIPFDLSKVMFIATANDISAMSRPLRDRMKIIEVDGYTDEEKIKIAQQHLIKKIIEESGLKDKNIRISDDVLQKLITDYTRESGVRQLGRTLKRLCSKIAREFVEKDKLISITTHNLEEHLGPQTFTQEESNKINKIGVSNGLAWTAYGGTMLKIEVILMPGKGKLILTGQLGDVMKESAQTALSYARAHAQEFGIDDQIFTRHDLHIHFPAGAIPKDGPSAGITILTTIISALTGRAVNAEYAMTGELNLSGDVMPIGGVKEKILAAKRNNIPHIILPKANKRDLVEIENITHDTDVILVSHVNEVLKRVLLPEAPTIQKSKNRK